MLGVGRRARAKQKESNRVAESEEPRGKGDSLEALATQSSSTRLQDLAETLAGQAKKRNQIVNIHPTSSPWGPIPTFFFSLHPGLPFFFLPFFSFCSVGMIRI